AAFFQVEDLVLDLSQRVVDRPDHVADGLLALFQIAPGRLLEGADGSEEVQIEGDSEGNGEHGEERGHAFFSFSCTLSGGSDIACSSCWISSGNLSAQKLFSLAWTSFWQRPKS